MKKDLLLHTKILNKKVLIEIFKLTTMILASLFIYVTCLIGYLLLGFKLDFLVLYIITSISMYPIILAYYYDKVIPASDWILSLLGIEIYDDESTIYEANDDIIQDTVPAKSSPINKTFNFIVSLVFEVFISIPSVLVIFSVGLPLVIYSIIFD